VSRLKLKNSWPQSLRPDTLSRNPAALKTEILNEKRVFADATHRVELYNIGPNPHAVDLVIAYFPTVKALYEADALDLPVVGDPRPGGPNTVALMQKTSGLEIRGEDDYSSARTTGSCRRSEDGGFSCSVTLGQKCDLLMRTTSFSAIEHPLRRFGRRIRAYIRLEKFAN
jgi:hypothetical protein